LKKFWEILGITFIGFPYLIILLVIELLKSFWLLFGLTLVFSFMFGLFNPEWDVKECVQYGSSLSLIVTVIKKFRGVFSKS